MITLKKNGLKLLKTVHLLVVCCWLGGASSMLMLNLNNSAAVSEGMLYGMNTASHLIDIWIILVLGVSGCVVTGLLYGIVTPWGFFKHKWIICKWAIVLIAMASATAYLGPGVEAMRELSRALGTNALYDDAYLAVKASHLRWSILQIILYILMVALSVVKPWGKKSVKTILANEKVT